MSIFLKFILNFLHKINFNAFSNVGCYIRADTGKSYFQIATIFAANINGTNPKRKNTNESIV